MVTGKRESLVRWALLIWALIGAAILVAGVIWLATRISAALAPFVVAALVVFMLRRPVARLSANGLSRGKAIAICYLVGASVLTLAGLFVIPPLVEQAREFISAFPKYLEYASQLWFRLQAQYTDMAIPDWLRDAVLAARDTISAQLADWSRALAAGVLGAGGRAVGFVINLFLALVLAFFVLRDLPVFKDEILRLAGGAERRQDATEVFGRITRVVEGWMRGQGTIAVIVGVLTWLGLEVLGVPYAAIIGVIAGITNLIPYLGPIVGGTVAAIAAAFVSPMHVLYAVLWIVALQQMESLFLQPRIMSDKINVHPALIIFSLLVGAQVAGFVGMLFAMPVAGILSALFVYYFEKHTDSQLATEHGALFRKASCEQEPEDSDEPDEAGEASVKDGAVQVSVNDVTDEERK